jgi:G8 domain
MLSSRLKCRLAHELLENRSFLNGDPVITDTHVVTDHDTIPRFAANAEFVAIRNGAWSDPLVWNARRVPTLGAKIQIPKNIAVQYDLDSSMAMEALEISGSLDFATDSDTALWVSEIMVMPHGSLTIGDQAAAIAESVTAEIVFTDTPPKTGTKDNPGLDVHNYGKGLIVFGELTINGTEKTAFARASGHIDAGAMTIDLDSNPVGWAPGDKLIFPETSQTVIKKVERFLNESEVAELVSQNGSEITLAETLQYPHRGLSVNSFGIERFAHVGNLSRNVVLRSENPDGNRGHVMATAGAQVQVFNAAFESLGRTSADRPVANTSFAEDGSVFAIGSNQGGRYPIHLHHLADSYLIEGVVVNDALKWGIAVHDTHNGVVRETIVFDSDGSAIVTEDGSEVGNQFIDNLVIKVDGGHQRLDGRAGAAQMLDAQGKLVVELGADGSGFWLRSSAGTFTGNTVYDAAGFGYNFNGYLNCPHFLSRCNESYV